MLSEEETAEMYELLLIRNSTPSVVKFRMAISKLLAERAELKKEIERLEKLVAETGREQGK